MMIHFESAGINETTTLVNFVVRRSIALEQITEHIVRLKALRWS